MHKVFIVNTNAQYDKMWLDLGFTIVASIEDADIVQFTGGSDVSPALYGQHKGERTHSNIGRDAQEVYSFIKAHEAGLPMVGICRGGQFLNVMAGGQMFQHVEGHTRYHSVMLSDEVSDVGVGIVTSTHHQMMRPNTNINHQLLVWAAEAHHDQQDTEVVFYPDSKLLCFQPHPEFGERDSEYTLNLFKKCLRHCFNIKGE